MVLLYQHDITGSPLADLYDKLEADERRAVDDFTRAVAEGVLGHREELDALIDESARGWPAHRLAALERNILRLAIYELRYRDDIPAEVSIDQAVELAKRYSSNEAGALVNGVLGSIAGMGAADK